MDLEPPKPIYNQLQPLYFVLAKATIRSKEDSEWGYVRDRLDEFISKIEKLLKTNERLGWNIHLKIIDKLNIFDKLEERWEIVSAVMELENDLDSFLAITKIVDDYVLKSRVITYFSAFLASLLLMIGANTVLNLFASSIVLAMMLASLLLINSKYSVYPAIVAVPLFSATILVWPYDIMVKTVVVVVLIMIVLTTYLPKMFEETLE